MAEMTPKVYEIFEEVCSQYVSQGPVLEVGAVPGSDSLLAMNCLKTVSSKIGINITVTSIVSDHEIIQGNANDMNMFDDGYFSTVLCNATLEHDPYFWLTITEIHRVTASGGLIVIGVPGFFGMGVNAFAPRRSFLGGLLRFYASISKSDVLLAGSVTLGEHFYPNDYYRFTEQAIKDIFLTKLNNVSIKKVLNPPRFIGWGTKP
jgi:SAM-dependent methyltransferase